MDTIVESARDVKSIIAAIASIRQGLVTKCFAMNGSAKHKIFEVLASKKVCKTILEYPHKKPERDEETPYLKKIAEFDNFTLFEYEHVDDNTIRIFARFDSGEKWHSAWFGKIDLK